MNLLKCHNLIMDKTLHELVRRSILLGLGGYQYAKDGIKSLVSELEKEGKLTPEEGKKLVDEVITKGKDAVSKKKDDLKDVVKEVMDEMGVATKEDIDELKNMINK